MYFYDGFTQLFVKMIDEDYFMAIFLKVYHIPFI